MKRALLASVMLALAVAVVFAPGRAVHAATAPAGPTVQLLGQDPFRTGAGLSTFDVGVTGLAAGDRLDLQIYSQLITRTGFQQAAAGHINDRLFYDLPIDVSKLPSDHHGGYLVQIPVNEYQPAGDPVTSIGGLNTGVYPVRFSVVDQNGNPAGQPRVTFLVYVVQSNSAGAIIPLSAAVVVPVSTSPSVSPGGSPEAPSASEAARLSQLGAALNADSSVRASVLASPMTLDQLTAGKSPAAVQALSNLSAATDGGPFQVLPSTYSPVTLGELSQSGLGGEIGYQLRAGSTVLTRVFGVKPEEGTWVDDGPMDASTLDALMAGGISRIIVPDSDLSPLPSEITTTFGRSTYLSSEPSSVPSSVSVVGADPGLTADFTRDEPPVLAANVLLAELAMIYTETPSVTRGVAVMPPPDWTVSPVFIQTLLNGLLGNPLVSAVTASSLFSVVGTPQGTRNLTAGRSPGDTAAVVSSLSTIAGSGSGTIAGARAAITDLASVFADQAAEIPALDMRLLVAETASLSTAQRLSILTAVGTATERVQNVVALPPATSITLTASKSQLPLTILTRRNVRPRIELVLQSQKLIFLPFDPPGGRCVVMTETAAEVCTLTLTTQNTTLKVPVETRSSGVFPLTVSIYPPGTPVNGRDWLARDPDTVRSTAVSGVAVILIGVALLALVVWWGRDLRRGRRPKGMVPAPVEPGSKIEVAPAGDSEVDRFFSRPPPDYPDGGMSPSGAVAGPSPTTDTYGPGRETRE